jgi:undecaprenyl-diphosphatase
MFTISRSTVSIPLYVFLILYFVYTQKKKAILSILTIALLVGLADYTSVHLFKNVFLRYRPCHNLEIQNLIHLVNNHCGGQYGFISSHASNVFSIAVLSSFIIRNKFFTISLLIWAILVSYSRIYLGVHYPLDILAGAIWGTFLAFVAYYLYLKLRIRFFA